MSSCSIVRAQDHTVGRGKSSESPRDGERDNDQAGRQHRQRERRPCDGDPALRVVAQELVTAMRKSTSVDWTIRESVRAKISVVVKKILRAHGFPPDLQEPAVKLVLEQAETLCRGWTGE
jgi:hypothetical protein